MMQHGMYAREMHARRSLRADLDRIKARADRRRREDARREAAAQAADARRADLEHAANAREDDARVSALKAWLAGFGRAVAFPGVAPC